MAVKNNRRTQITKLLLRDALLQLMKDRPISRITIKDLCELADMSRSTFYLHYQDPFQLLEEIEKEVLETTIGHLEDLSSIHSSKEAIAKFLTYVKNNVDTFGLLLCSNENQSFQQAILDQVQNLVKSKVSTGLPPEQEKYLYSFVMNGVLCMLRDWISSEFDLPVRDLADIIYTACNQVIH